MVSGSEGSTFTGGPIASEGIDEVCGSIGKKIVGAVKASHALPIPDEFAYYRQFPAFKRALDSGKGTGTGVGSRALRLLARLVAHQAPNDEPGALAGGHAGADTEDMFDEVVDFADARLEAVDVLLDDLQGKAPAVRPQRLHTGGRSLGGGRAGGKARGVPEDLGLAKPQLRFSDPIDNSTAPFVPKVWPKVHAVPPVTPGASAGSHPYASEIASLQYAQDQLAAPSGKLQPPGKMEDVPFQWVSTPAQLKEAVQVFQKSRELALDLEHHSLRSFQGFTCLIQASTRDRDYIIDAIELRAHMHMLLGVFTDPTITKVLHGADSDVKWLQRDFGLYLVNMFDTGQASRVLNLPSFGYAYLLDTICGEQTDKQLQLADWRLRPLPVELLRYARTDTHYLLHIYDRLRQDLWEKAKDESKPNGDDSLVRAVLANSAAVCQLQYEKEVPSPGAHLATISRSGRTLTVKETAVFAALYAWRDRIARAEDESSGFVISNGVMFKIAAALPSDKNALLAACRPMAPPLVREHAEEVAKLVAEAAAGASASGTEESQGQSHGQGQSQSQGQSQAGGAGIVGAAGGGDALMDSVLVEVGWVLEAPAPAEANGPRPEVALAPANRGGSGSRPLAGSLHGGAQTLQGAGSEPQEGDAAQAVQRIRAGLAGLPVVALPPPPPPAAPAAAEVKSEVADAAGVRDSRGRTVLDADAPRSIADMFGVRAGKARKRASGAAAGAVEGAEDGQAEDDSEARHAKARRAEAAADAYSRGSDPADPGAFMDQVGWKVGAGAEEEEEGGFRAFDYAKAAADAEAAAVPAVAQFDPHGTIGGDVQSKQVRQNPRAKAADRGATFGSKGNAAPRARQSVAAGGLRGAPEEVRSRAAGAPKRP